MQYEYDTYGNMTSREDGNWGMTEDFGYDNLNRLVSTPAGDITYDGKGKFPGRFRKGISVFTNNGKEITRLYIEGVMTSPKQTK